VLVAGLLRHPDRGAGGGTRWQRSVRGSGARVCGRCLIAQVAAQLIYAWRKSAVAQLAWPGLGVTGARSLCASDGRGGRFEK